MALKKRNMLSGLAFIVVAIVLAYYNLIQDAESLAGAGQTVQYIVYILVVVLAGFGVLSLLRSQER